MIGQLPASWAAVGPVSSRVDAMDEHQCRQHSTRTLNCRCRRRRLLTPTRRLHARCPEQTCSRTTASGSRACSSSTRTRWCWRCGDRGIDAATIVECLVARRVRLQCCFAWPGCQPTRPPGPTPYPPTEQELKQLSDDAAVYKAIGPALVRQEAGEAAANVGKRLQFIGGERGAAACCSQAPWNGWGG